MDIQTALSNARTFSEILPLAERAEYKVSFWGKHYICVPGYEETLNVSALAGRVIELLQQNKYEFSETERFSGRRLAGRIDYLFEESDRQWNKTNCLIKPLLMLVGFFHSLFSGQLNTGIRYRWAQGPLNLPNDDFNYYTQTQLRTTFGISPDEAERRGYCRNHVDGIRRWYVL